MITDRFVSLGALSWIAGSELSVGIAKCWAGSKIKKWVSGNYPRWWTKTSGRNHVKELLGPWRKLNWTEFIYSSNRRKTNRLLVQIITRHESEILPTQDGVLHRGRLQMVWRGK